MMQPTAARALKGDNWITDEEVPDLTAEELPRLPGYFMLVRPVSIRKETKGGIILPNSTAEDMAYLTTVGKVLKLGELAYRDPDKFAEGPWCKEGDYVCYGKFTGNKFMFKGHKLLLMFDDQVMMVVDDPKELDQTFNLSN